MARRPSPASSIALKQAFNGEGVVPSYVRDKGHNDVHDMKEKTMRFTAIALAFAFALSSTGAFAFTPRHESGTRVHRGQQGMSKPPKVSRNYGNPNGNPDGPTSLSGTGSSQFGGSSPGTSGRN
jgi:hypothetical protein